jgi:peptide deformylase
VDDGPDGKLILHPPQVLINPVLSDPSQESEEMSEGCLSIPALSAPVRRPLSIRLQATDLEGRSIDRRLEGFEARVAMHENDHLNGVLYIDRISEPEKRRLKVPLRELRQKLKKESK